MPRLANSKHERFCALVVAGRSPGAAYAECGYRSKTPGIQAYAVMQREDVKARIAELRTSQAQQVAQIDTGPDLSTIGITVGWIASAYDRIKQCAIEAGDFKAANTAIDGVQSLLETERRMIEDKQTSKAVTPAKIDIHVLGGALDRVASLIAESKSAPSRPAMKALAAADNET